jgi:plasmid stabilization system protein ParE
LFHEELDRALVRLEEQPEIAPKVRMRGRSGIHAIVLQRTGYLVFYHLDANAREVSVVRVRRGHRRPRLRSSSALRFVNPSRNASKAGLKAGASSASSIPTCPRAIRDSISWTHRFACAFVGWRDGL